jgi:arylsulfatase A-like enzyme
LSKLLQKSLQGMFWGMIVWQIYAIVEFADVTLGPLLIHRNLTVAGWHWKLSALLFAVYSLAGAAAGALGVVLFALIAGSRAPSQEVFKTVGTLTLVAAFLANLLYGMREPAPVLLSAAVAAALIWRLADEHRSKGLGLLANPWVTIPFLLMVAYVNHDAFRSRSILLQGSVTLALAGLFLGISILRSRMKTPRRAGGVLRQAGAVAGAGALLLLTCGVFLLNDDLHASDSVAPGNESRPNVILLTLDTVRADHLSLYGYSRDTTAHLIHLAESATLFTHVSAAGDMTLTSHAAIFTGTYASWNEAKPISTHDQATPISAAYPTIAEILGKQGYSTAAVIANFGFLRPPWGLDRGFQVFYRQHPLSLLPGGKEYCIRFGARELLSHFTDTAEFDVQYLRAEDVNRRAYRFLDHAGHSGRPFFLFINYMDAHYPYVPKTPYDRLFPGKDRSIPHGRGTELFEELANGRGRISPNERQNFTSQYDGGIAYMDAQIGDLLSTLKQLHLYDNTLIIITSDHGEALGEKNLLGHWLSVDQDQVNVPLIVKYPGQSQKRVVESRVGHTDILPTIVDVTRATPPKFVQGVSLPGGVANEHRKYFSESFPQTLNKRFDRIERAIYEENFKFIESTAGRRELYDLTADPGESKDLCSAEGARCSRMQEELDAWVSAIPKHTGPTRKIDSQTLERLRSLGYVGR